MSVMRQRAEHQDEQSWHALSVDETLRRLGASRKGLTSAECVRRLTEYGPNKLPEARPPSPLLRFLAQFNHLLIYVLLGAAVITALLGHIVDTVVILLVVIVNALVGFIQEGRAEKALDAIRGLIVRNASVVRDGRRETVAAADIVPGDILILEPGDRVVADVRLVKVRSLRIEESALTGESVPVEKTIEPTSVETSLGDRKSMAFSGTLVVAGQGVGVVVATGEVTELGRISSLLARVEVLSTPLLRQINVFARQLTIAILVISAAVFAFAVLVREYPFAEALMAVVGVAVAAIPEGLPAVISITLAIGVQRMAARNAIIRKLPAVETLGSVSVICTDKTGTLTRNEMTVRSVVTASCTYGVSGVGYEPRGEFSIAGRQILPRNDGSLDELLRAVLLCNDCSLFQDKKKGWSVHGDPMEGALITLAVKAGLDVESTQDAFARYDEVPFDAAYGFMATLHQGIGDSVLVYVKGAPERVLAMSERQRTDAGNVALKKEWWTSKADELAADGQRVLGVAMKKMFDGSRVLSAEDVGDGLVFLGLVGFLDPPREEAISAVCECRGAGIDVKMITGDHVTTARAIAGQLGIEHADRGITGQMLDALDGVAFRDAARTVNVFARTSPEHKLKLVTALQAGGAVISMTGDGVNDAPALKRADVGVAMGCKGTEAAKEAAEMVLVDDNFASIVAAVREGRTVYDNLTKVIAWTLPTSGGEALAIITAILFGLELPITPVQILWINMVTAVALGTTLAFEPTEPDVMARPPRAPNEPLLSRLLVWRVFFVSVLFATAALGLFAWANSQGVPYETSRTMVVNMLVVMEIFYLFSVRYLRVTSLTWQGVVGTPAVLIGVTAIVLLQFLFTYAPFMQGWFDTRALTLFDGGVIVALGVVFFVVLELEKFAVRGLCSLMTGRRSSEPAVLPGI